MIQLNLIWLDSLGVLFVEFLECFRCSYESENDLTSYFSYIHRSRYLACHIILEEAFYFVWHLIRILDVYFREWSFFVSTHFNLLAILVNMCPDELLVKFFLVHFIDTCFHFKINQVAGSVWEKDIKIH